MFAGKRTISVPFLQVSYTKPTEAVGDTNKKANMNLNLQNRDTEHIKTQIEYVPSLQQRKHTRCCSAAVLPGAMTAFSINALQTYRIGQAYHSLRQSIIDRGLTYQNNSLSSRQGYIAENFVAESYNLDAVIQRHPDRAYVPQSNKNASADIVFNYGKSEASLKYYKDAQSSAKAQTNPDYGNQTAIVPSDQSQDAKLYLEQLAHKNELKGRIQAAEQQRSTAQRIDCVLRSEDGKLHSTPASRKQTNAMAEAFDEKGVNITKLDRALEDTGITRKVRHAKVMNELSGIGIAAAIGLGMGFAIGVAVSLAQNGLNPNSLKYAVASGAAQGASGAVMAGAGAVLGILVRPAAESIAEFAIKHMSTNIAAATAENIVAVCNIAVIGSITTAAFLTYEFVKLKMQGYSTKECLLRTGKSAALAFSILIVSVVAQGVWGGPVGIVVSITAGVILTGYTVAKIVHDKTVSKDITYHSIDLCKPAFS